ncbi:unnamed protein product [Gongylonema pulchrum]|uniref:Uncharacterized protein n=1 Tax=Gongylonema pulchrum TaxID=637853 RepID=A0A3P7QWI3_9BILA|nr:unnamed protein product [Gongylonema pulchrum]
MSISADLNINLVQKTVSTIYNDILKSIETEKEAVCLTPTKAAVENPDRLRSVLKEKAYKSQIVHARHRRHFIDPSIPSTSADDRNQENPVTAAKMVETLKSYAASKFDRDVDVESTLALSESESSITKAEDGKVGVFSPTKKGATGRKRRRSRLSEMSSLSGLTHRTAGSVAVLNRDGSDIENAKKEKIADRLFEKIQKAQEKKTGKQ